MSKELSSAGGRPVASQIKIIRVIAVLEILLSIVVILSQTVAIGASNVYATRSLTGIWTSWFFFIAAGLALFWSSRCTFNGLLSVLVLQIVGATMTVPLFVSCCILLAVYEFQWTAEKESDNAKVGSSIAMLSTNLIMMCSGVILFKLFAYNAYNCWLLAYGGHKDGYDRQSARSANSAEENGEQVDAQTNSEELDGKADANNALPNLSTKDIRVIKYSGIAGMIIALKIFCCQVALFVLATSNGISIGIGIWGALYYGVTGLVALYTGYRPTSQSIVATFVLQVVQFILTMPLVAIAFYIVAVFGTCVQDMPLEECGKEGYGVGLAVSILGGLMAVNGMAQGLLSLVLILICLQAVCGLRCMISGATVYPSS